jgi:hypothetical protein
MSTALADGEIKMRDKLRKFVEMLKKWPILWRDLPVAYNLDPRGGILRKFFDTPPPGSNFTHKDIAKHAGLSAALHLIVDAYDHDTGRFDRAPPELYEDLTELALALAVDVSVGTRQALKAAPRSATDPVPSLGRPTSSPAVPGPVSSLGHVVPTGGACASLSSVNNALGSPQHHCREVAEGATTRPSTYTQRLSNAQVKKLRRPERARYKALIKAQTTGNAAASSGGVSESNGGDEEDA